MRISNDVRRKETTGGLNLPEHSTPYLWRSSRQLDFRQTFRHFFQRRPLTHSFFRFGSPLTTFSQSHIVYISCLQTVFGPPTIIQLLYRTRVFDCRFLFFVFITNRQNKLYTCASIGKNPPTRTAGTHDIVFRRSYTYERMYSNSHMGEPTRTDNCREVRVLLNTRFVEFSLNFSTKVIVRSKLFRFSLRGGGGRDFH